MKGSTPRFWVATYLTDALLAVHWTFPDLLTCSSTVLGPSTAEEQASLIAHLIEQNATPYAPSPSRLRRMILDAPAFEVAALRALEHYKSILPVIEPPPFTPIGAFKQLDHVRLATVGAFAEWLSLSITELQWLADERRLQSRCADAALEHYTFTWIPKRSGTPRLIEAPKSHLKHVQKKILRDILDHVPAHPVVHGFVRKRSPITAAAPHAGEALVITLDLRDYFLTTPLRRVHGLFRTLGYPWKVARLLTSLCGVSTPARVFSGADASRSVSFPTRVLYLNRHLPQGAPTSPALANLCSYRLDVRLAGLATKMDMTYTRYADDLVLSGDRLSPRRLERLLETIAQIVSDEGYAINRPKTKVRTRSARQSVMGIVVNDHVNVPRDEYDRLKAILHNCVRHGPASQIRDALPDFRLHLTGRVTWVEQVNPRRAIKLRELLEKIQW